MLNHNERLKDSDYYLTAVVVNVDMTSWCPRSWAGIVPEDARDRFGYLPKSNDEAGETIYRCMKFHHFFYGVNEVDRNDVEGRVEEVVDSIKFNGWGQWNPKLEHHNQLSVHRTANWLLYKEGADETDDDGCLWGVMVNDKDCDDDDTAVLSDEDQEPCGNRIVGTRKNLNHTACWFTSRVCRNCVWSICAVR